MDLHPLSVAALHTTLVGTDAFSCGYRLTDRGKACER
jgi:hypothetical protein